MSLSKTKRAPTATRPFSLQKVMRRVPAIRQAAIHPIYWLLWGVLIILYLAWPLTHLEIYGLTNDEGLYLQRAALGNAGYSLYSEAAFNKPPLLIWLLQLAFKIGGQTVSTGRLTILGLTLAGFVAFGKVAQQLWGRWAGLVSAGILLALPEIPVRAHTITSDLPAVSFTMIALWAALAFRCNGRRSHLILASLAITTALLIHPLLIHVAVPLALILLWPTSTLPACMTNKPISKKEFALFVSVAIAIVLVTLAAIEWHTFFQWVFSTNVEIAQNVTTLATNWHWIMNTLKDHWLLGWLAVVGTIALYPTAKRYNLLITLAWFIATIAIFLVWSPLWEHYRLFVALPLIVVAGGGLTALGASSTDKRRPWQRAFITILAFTGLIFFGVTRWQATRPQLLESGRQWTADHLAARAFLGEQTTADEFVTTDDPLLAFAANRLVPPALTEATLKMIDTGFFTLDDALESTLAYEAHSVLFATGRLALLPGFEEWVTAVATGRTDFGSIRTYTLDLPMLPTQPIMTQFGEGISLQGFTLAENILRPGEPLTLTLFWQRNGPVSQDYHLFVHIVDDTDQLIAQLDGPPISRYYPTYEWAEGLLLPDPHIIEIGPDVPPGTYRLIVGMYEWPSLVRIPAFRTDGSRWPDDRILLTELTLSKNQ